MIKTSSKNKIRLNILKNIYIDNFPLFFKKESKKRN